MSYAYPESLPEIIEARWSSADLGGLVTAPLPDRADMLALVHVAFQPILEVPDASERIARPGRSRLAHNHAANAFTNSLRS